MENWTDPFFQAANEVNSGFTRSIRVHDNLIVGTTHRGITIAGYEQNGPVEDIEIFNNTIVGCGNDASAWEGAGLVIEADSPQNKNFIVRNNVLSGNQTGINTNSQTYLILDRNLIHGPSSITGNNAILADPGFSDPANGNYGLSSDSPAIDAALGSPLSQTDHADVIRPLDGDGDGHALVDLGAFEYRNR